MTKPPLYAFTLPSLDRDTYARLCELRDKQQINQHGLVTIAINLLWEVLVNGHGDVTIHELLHEIQIKTHVRRLTKPTV